MRGEAEGDEEGRCSLSSTFITHASMHACERALRPPSPPALTRSNLSTGAHVHVAGRPVHHPPGGPQARRQRRGARMHLGVQNGVPAYSRGNLREHLPHVVPDTRRAKRAHAKRQLLSASVLHGRVLLAASAHPTGCDIVGMKSASRPYMSVSDSSPLKRLMSATCECRSLVGRGSYDGATPLAAAMLLASPSRCT